MMRHDMYELESHSLRDGTLSLYRAKDLNASRRFLIEWIKIVDDKTTTIFYHFNLETTAVALYTKILLDNY